MNISYLLILSRIQGLINPKSEKNSSLFAMAHLKSHLTSWHPSFVVPLPAATFLSRPLLVRALPPFPCPRPVFHPLPRPTPLVAMPSPSLSARSPLSSHTSSSSTANSKLHATSSRARLLRGSDPHDLSVAASLLRSGRLVAFPTETVYGLGADATNTDAVSAIFSAKRRPADNPLIVHIAALSDLAKYDLTPLPLSPIADQLTRAFWPGPLTLILPLSPTSPIAQLVTANLTSIAVRIPQHPVARALLRAAECPVAAPSANRSGRPSPTSPMHVLTDLADDIDAVVDDMSETNTPVVAAANDVVDISCHSVDRERVNKLKSATNGNVTGTSRTSSTTNSTDFQNNGVTMVGLESTVVDLSIIDQHTSQVLNPCVLRPGSISVEDLNRVTGIQFGNALSNSSSASKLNNHTATIASQPATLSAPKAPGMKYRHYAPVAPVHLVDGLVALEAALNQQTGDMKLDGKNSPRIGVMANKDLCRTIRKWHYQHCQLVCVVCGEDDSAAAFGRDLYAALRAFDGEGPHAVHPPVDMIYALPPSDQQSGIGGAVMNRLSKAAAGRDEHVNETNQQTRYDGHVS